MYYFNSDAKMLNWYIIIFVIHIKWFLRVYKWDHGWICKALTKILLTIYDPYKAFDISPQLQKQTCYNFNISYLLLTFFVVIMKNVYITNDNC